MVRQFTFRRHLCIVFEMLGANLYEYLATNDFRPPSPTLLRRSLLMSSVGSIVGEVSLSCCLL